MPRTFPALCSDLSELQLEPVDAATYGDSFLSNTIYLGGYAFHCWAYEVDADSPMLDPIHSGYALDLDHICEMLGTRPSTQTFNGKTYVIAIVPHGE